MRETGQKNAKNAAQNYPLCAKITPSVTVFDRRSPTPTAQKGHFSLQNASSARTFDLTDFKEILNTLVRVIITEHAQIL